MSTKHNPRRGAADEGKEIIYEPIAPNKVLMAAALDILAVADAAFRRKSEDSDLPVIA